MKAKVSVIILKLKYLQSNFVVRGYTTTKSLAASTTTGLEQDTVRELLVRKQALMLELKHYENNAKYNENPLNQMESYESNGVIPANTRLQIGIATSDNKSKNVRLINNFCFKLFIWHEGFLLPKTIKTI